MKAHEFIALGLQRGERVLVTTTEEETIETTYDGLYTFGIEIISDPDKQLQPRFRAPTLDYWGGQMHNPLSSLKTVQRKNTQTTKQ